ncbi:MAG: NAD(P)-dependent oxidoreductase [Simkania sp.]|nr:NAD(P)-dependent oxidoreductase [Simkania sp.]
MNILVTGGAGFLGSQIARYHHKKGDVVWIIDDFSTGAIENIDQDFFRVDSADMRSYTFLAEALKWADLVYHMAATVGQKWVLSNPERTFLNNIQCCEVLLEKAQPHNRILIPSSASVYWYGVVGEQTLRENSILKIPSGRAIQQAYGMSKLVCEALAQMSGHHCVIVRLFNIFGPGQKSVGGSVVPMWMKQCMHNEPISIYGSGEQIRSFIYVEDAILAMERLLEKDLSKGEIYNIGNEHLISLIDLAQLIKKITRSRSEEVYIPYEKAYGIDFEEALNIPPSFEKFHQAVDFHSLWSLEEGIARIYANLS